MRVRAYAIMYYDVEMEAMMEGTKSGAARAAPAAPPPTALYFLLWHVVYDNVGINNFKILMNWNGTLCSRHRMRLVTTIT